MGRLHLTITLKRNDDDNDDDNDDNDDDILTLEDWSRHTLKLFTIYIDRMSWQQIEGN